MSKTIGRALLLGSSSEWLSASRGSRWQACCNRLVVVMGANRVVDAMLHPRGNCVHNNRAFNVSLLLKLEGWRGDDV